MCCNVCLYFCVNVCDLVVKIRALGTLISMIFIFKKKPEDNNLTKEALWSILNDNSKELENLFARMQKFNTNVVGSNVHFCKRRSELEALIK